MNFGGLSFSAIWRARERTLLQKRSKQASERAKGNGSEKEEVEKKKKTEKTKGKKFTLDLIVVTSNL